VLGLGHRDGREHAEDSFSFLNRADGSVWRRIRDKLNDWYAALPDGDESVRRRFRKADPRQHYAAWWELYMHALLRALGFDVTVHPDVPGTDGHPDFLAERGKESFYVEGRNSLLGNSRRRPTCPT
jgi:hypothetical protein